MKILFSLKSNNFMKPQNIKLNFGAGLTPKMMEEIKRTDVLEISNKFAKKGIATNFNENKVIAWCCDKTVEILEEINKKFGQKWTFPNVIEVENFELLNVENHTALGTCNMLPTKLRKISDEKTPSKAIFFNSLYNWENIDKIADNDYAVGLSSTPHFLNFCLHEFVHSAHEDRLLKKLGAKILTKEFNLYKYEKKTVSYQQKYGEMVSKICKNAKLNPFEAIACDIPKIITNNLDKETLKLTKNPFIETPYEVLPFWKRVNIQNSHDEKHHLNKILRNFWNGKFD